MSNFVTAVQGDPLNKTLKTGIRIIALQNVTKDGQFLEDPYFYVTEEQASEKDILLPNDILFNWRSGSKEHIGKTFFFDFDGIFTHVGFLLRIRQINEEVDPRYLDTYLKYIKQRGFFYGAKFQVNNTFNKSELLELPVVIPPLAEQQKIAAILSTWDEAIALTEALIEALQRRKKALMQRLLTGEVREKWEQHKLGEVADVILSSVDKKTRDDDQDVRLCNYMDVFYNNYIHNKMDFMESTANEREIEKCTLNLYDVIITKDSETVEDIAQAAVVVENLTNVICGYHLAILRTNEDMLYGPFLRELLMTPDIHYQFESRANGATRFGLTLSSIQNLEIPIPELDEQEQIADVLYLCDQEIEYLLQYKEVLGIQKKGLMQQLLTGRIRVAVDAHG